MIVSYFYSAISGCPHLTIGPVQGFEVVHLGERRRGPDPVSKAVARLCLPV
jgi:hypothetical protein